MAKVEVKTAVVADGLRYKTKTPGSPFRASASFSGATMSCFMCGKHRVRSQLRTRQVLGKSQTVCAPFLQGPGRGPRRRQLRKNGVPNSGYSVNISRRQAHDSLATFAQSKRAD